MFSTIAMFVGLAGILGTVVCLIGLIISSLSHKRTKGWVFSLILFIVFSVTGIFLLLAAAPKEYSTGKDFISAPIIIYTTTAEDNGLRDKNMFVEGVVGKTKKAENIEACEITTSDGKIAMLSVPFVTPSEEWKKLKEGTTVKVYFQYLGHSDVLNEASGALLKVSEVIRK